MATIVIALLFLTSIISQTTANPLIPSNIPDCEGVSCIPSPSPGNCKPRFDQDNCCPLWYCDGNEGGLYTSFGRNQVKEDDSGNEFAESSEMSSSGVQGQINGIEVPPAEAALFMNEIFPSKIFSPVENPNSEERK